MRPSRVLVGLAALALIAPACRSVDPDLSDIQIEASANPKVQFTGYSTYAWAAAGAAIRDPEGEWTPTDLDVGAEIVQLVNRELRDRGMTEVVRDPDVLVIYGVGVDMQALQVVVDEESGMESTVQTPKGGVVVVLADPESRRLMWVGTAEGDLKEDPNPELVRKRLDHGVVEMFKRFPR